MRKAPVGPEKLLDMCRIILLRDKSPFGGNLDAEIGDEPMKRALRMVILMVGLVGTFVTATVTVLPAQDGGPLILCPPRTNCGP